MKLISSKIFNMRLSEPFQVMLPRRLVLNLLGDQLFLVISPEKISGEVRISEKRYFSPRGDWDINYTETRFTETYSIMEAIIAGPDSVLWKQKRSYLMCQVKNQPLRRSNNWMLFNDQDVDDYLRYCFDLAVAVKKQKLKDKHSPLTVAIGRGPSVFRTGDGRHRLSAALLLGVPLVARVNHIHIDVLRGASVADVVDNLRNSLLYVD